MTTINDLGGAPVAAFLKACGWDDAAIALLAGDASTRRYARLTKGGAERLLMIAPPQAETAACPPNASSAKRTALGYNAVARLAGPNIHAFVEIARLLRGIGLSAPEVYAADPDAGLALIEDFGDDLFARVIPAQPERTLYEAAVDVLSKIAEANAYAPKTAAYAMLTYDATALAAEADLMTEWYWPLRTGAVAPDDAAAEARALWADLIDKLAPPQTIVLRDFHAENLLWLPARPAPGNVGLIDFQDALVGSPAYDLVSLLEDARRDVAPGLASAMFERRLVRIADAAARDRFSTDYAILAAQRNAKILGIFARLAKRDGKTRYLDLLPRVEAHFRRDLARPELAGLRAFLTRYFPEFAS